MYETRNRKGSGSLSCDFRCLFALRFFRLQLFGLLLSFNLVLVSVAHSKILCLCDLIELFVAKVSFYDISLILFRHLFSFLHFTVCG
jgi:hypothetical protein